MKLFSCRFGELYRAEGSGTVSIDGVEIPSNPNYLFKYRFSYTITDMTSSMKTVQTMSKIVVERELFTRKQYGVRVENIVLELLKDREHEVTKEIVAPYASGEFDSYADLRTKNVAKALQEM